MKVDWVRLREIGLPLIHPFETSFGATRERRVLLVEVGSEGLTGWGECVAGEGPFYSSETVETAWAILTAHILPQLPGWSWEHPSQFPSRVEGIRGHRMAKACVEAALWDLFAQVRRQPLWQVLGGTLSRIPCGVSIGIQRSPAQLLEKIEQELGAGYRKIKIKIKPGWDVEIVRQVRKHFPEIPLMVDANSAYRLQDAQHLRRLDAFQLMMIEQPLAHDDLFEHAQLQRQLETPLCLDESIRHARDAQHALQLGACRIINIKMGRVGGPTEALRIHELCRQQGIPVWCGGMLETGIGRAHNIALSTLPNFTLPGDVSASRRYYQKDTIEPPVEVDREGFITPPSGIGLGFRPDVPFIDSVTTRRISFPERKT